MLEAIKFVISEHINNRDLLIKMAKVNMKKQTFRTSLGVLWLYIHDIVYFSMFVLFRVLMAGSGKVDGMHNVVYLITGLIPWFFISEVLNVGANSIKANKSIIMSIKFPITIIPAYEVLGIFLKRLVTFLFIFLVCGVYGYLGNFNLFLFIYYMVCMLVFMYCLIFPISAFVAVSTDFQQLYLVLTKVLMYIMPIIWGFKHINQYTTLCKVVKLNPMVYILNGFRSAFVYGNLPTLRYSLYFWGFVIVLFMLGSFVQYKLRKYYSDFI